MAGLRLSLSGDLQYGVGLKLTPELKQALLTAQQLGQAMSMTFGGEQAANAIRIGTSSFSFNRAADDLDSRIISTGSHAGHDAAEIAAIHQRISVQRDLSKAVSERVRASKEEADNARKGRTLQKLDDAPAGQGVKHIVSESRPDSANRPKAKPRPASAAFAGKPGQPGPSIARAATPPPLAAMNAAASLPADGPAKQVQQGLPPVGPAAAKRVQPKGKLQKAAAKHQKAMGGRGAVAPGAGKPAAAPGTGQQPQAPQKLAASDLVIKAAVVGGLRLCLMMIMMERARKTDKVMTITQQVSERVPRLRHPNKEAIKATLESVGEFRAPGAWHVQARLRDEAQAFQTAFETGADLARWEKGHVLPSTLAGRQGPVPGADAPPSAANIPPGDPSHKAEAPAQPDGDGINASQQSVSDATTLDQQPELEGVSQQQQSRPKVSSQPSNLQADKAEKKKQRKRLREAGQAPANAPAPVAPAVPHAETPPAGEGEAESVHKRQQMDHAPQQQEAAAAHASRQHEHSHMPAAVTPSAEGGVPQDGTAANGHGPPDGTSNGHAQSYDSESDGSELLAPLSPEPELDKFDHEQPVDAGPVGSHEQYLERTQWYYDKYETYHMLHIRIAAFRDEVAALQQAASEHTEDLRGWARAARHLQRQQRPSVERWDHIVKTLHQELQTDTDQLQQFVQAVRRGNAPGMAPVSIAATASMA